MKIFEEDGTLKIIGEDGTLNYSIMLIIATAIIGGAIIGAIIGIVARGNYPLSDKAYRIIELIPEKEEIKLTEMGSKNPQIFKISKICLRDYSPKAIVLIVGKTHDDCIWLKE